jgi:hypothetical protein
MNNRYLFSIILVVFIDLLGFSLIIPLLPYYAQTFNASDTTIGLLLSSYAAAQLIGAPLLGRASDRYGRRPILLISIFGTFLGFLLFGFANSLAMLFASRILQGLTGGNLSVAQAYITDVTDSKSRSYFGCPNHCPWRSAFCLAKGDQHFHSADFSRLCSIHSQVHCLSHVSCIAWLLSFCRASFPFLHSSALT